MSREDYLLKLHQVLIKRRDALLKVLASEVNLLEDLKTQAAAETAPLDSIQDEITYQLVEVERRELLRIERALERIKNGQYGICENCEAPISLARLNVLPYATRCIKCQLEAERNPPPEMQPEPDARLDFVDPVEGWEY